MIRLHRSERSAAQRRTSIPIGAVTVVMTVATLGPLIMLTYLSLTLSSTSLRKEIDARLESTVAVSASYIGQQMDSLVELVSSVASRPNLIETLQRPGPLDRTSLRVHLLALLEARPGLGVVFLARPDGKLVDVLPATPSIIGDDFSYRDWYKGVVSTEDAYVSRAYRSAAAGRPRVVAAAAPVWQKGAQRKGRMIGILVAGYDLATVQSFAEDAASAYGIKITVTDHAGVILAAPGAPSGLVSRRDDPSIAAALQGRRGVLEHGSGEDAVLSAYVPVPGIRWAVSASVPAATALSDITSLRSALLGFGAFYAVILAGGLTVLTMVLRRLARERAKSEAMLDSIGTGILIVDTSGYIVAANPAVERLLGWPRGEAIGRLYSEVCRAYDSQGRPLPESRRLLPQALARGEVIETTGFDLFFETRDGRRIPVGVTAAPITDDRNRVIGAVEVVRDVSKDREIDHLKSSLVSTVSHELRTPLTIMQGFSELLVTRNLDAAKAREVATEIHSSSLRLSRLVDNLLSVSRIESGRFAVHTELIDLNAVIEEVVSPFERDFDRRFERDLAYDVVVVRADRDKLVQVLTNLVSNAVKYSPEGSEITIRTKREGNTAVIAIDDEGIGLTEEERDRLFEKFFRADRPEVRNVAGTGLGLYITKSLVELQRGQLWVEDRATKGTTFAFSLPLVDEITAVPSAALSSNHEDPL